MSPALITVTAIWLALAGSATAAPDNLAGSRAWLQCRACHSLKAGEPNKVGPNLNGIMGARAATRPGFSYSGPLAASAIVWTEASLDVWITNPAHKVPGTRMAYAGLADPVKRQALIAYLKAESR